MDLSIVIVSWNVKELLQKCLSSIFEFTKNMEFEIIVIDNDSQDQSAEMIITKFPQVNLIASKKNLGFAKANNLGLNQAQGKYVLFMNPDMELVENSFPIMFMLMEQNPQAAISTCQLFYPNKQRQDNIKNNPDFCSQAIILLKLHHLFKPKCLLAYLAKNFDYHKEKTVSQIMGAFMFCNKEKIKQINGWDENFFLWFEEVDLCKRVQEQNWQIIYTPKAKIIHHESQSFKQNSSLLRQKRFTQSMKKYFKKHHNWLEYNLLSFLALISLGLAFISQILKIKPKTQSKI